MHEALLAMAAWLKREDDFLLIAHVSPDGDTMGSCLALYGILQGMGKRAQVCCEQEVPLKYQYMPWTKNVGQPDQIKNPFKNAIAVDCGDVERMGAARQLFDSARERCNIDHHLTNNMFGDYVVHDAQVSATGELVYSLWCVIEKEPFQNPRAKEIATCLYTAICTDTGNFCYTNTAPSTFRLAAALLETGIDIQTVNREVYRTISIGKTHLQGFILSNIELYAQGRVAFALVMYADILRYGTKSEDMEGMIDFLRDIDSVEIAILIREARDGSFKTSLRSKIYADVSELAHHFGGGGHLHAAGCTMKGDPLALKLQLIELAGRLLS